MEGAMHASIARPPPAARHWSTHGRRSKNSSAKCSSMTDAIAPLIRSLVAAIAVLGVLTGSAEAQTPPAAQPVAPGQVLMLQDALQYALDHYPAIKAAIEQVNASTAGV